MTRSRPALLGLQAAVAIGGLVPVSAGIAGILAGPGLVTTQPPTVPLDSHFRYLSGLLLGIGVAFWTTIPHLERRTGRFRLLTSLVVAGGVGRLVGIVQHGAPSGPMLGGLAMELLVTPLLCLWQAAIARDR